MGIAVLSGVIASLDSASVPAYTGPKWESHTPGTVTPALGGSDDDDLPSRFIACVSREESAKRLRGLFFSLGGLGPSVEVFVGNNVQAVQQSDVVLLWCVQSPVIRVSCTEDILSAASRSWPMRSSASPASRKLSKANSSSVFLLV